MLGEERGLHDGLHKKNEKMKQEEELFRCSTPAALNTVELKDMSWILSVQVGEKFNVALANSGVDSATVSARGHTNGAAAWPSRRNDCRPSSICTVCTIGRDAPYRRPCGTSSSRRGSVAATTASSPSTLSAGPCSVGTPGTAAGKLLNTLNATPFPFTPKLVVMRALLGRTDRQGLNGKSSAGP
ncbi:hypothetical protein WN48_09879 [Eufriesea mexicana]|nr:hypothetical protein WN48_09879 [Eufriesea mexicana]